MPLTDPNAYAFSHSDGSGLTVREYFACHIMSGLMNIELSEPAKTMGYRQLLSHTAISAVHAADALIAALNAKQEVSPDVPT